jgi:hypothetical protein
MTRAELIAKIRTYSADYTLKELEGTDILRLECLLRLLESHTEIERREDSDFRSINSQRLGDEPPELTMDDEEILNRVWAQLAEAERTN